MKEINPFREENTINDLLLYYIDEDIRHIVATDILEYRIYDIIEKNNFSNFNDLSIFNLYRVIFSQMRSEDKLDFYSDLYSKEKSLEENYIYTTAC